MEGVVIADQAAWEIVEIGSESVGEGYAEEGLYFGAFEGKGDSHETKEEKQGFDAWHGGLGGC